MRNIMIFAVVMAALGTFMAQMADKMTATTPALADAASRKADSVETVGQSSSRSLSIPRDSRGHFETEGRIDGQRIGFMVDTGASVIALNESSAARFGLRPSRGDYNATVTTANGTVKAARTRLALVELGLPFPFGFFKFGFERRAARTHRLGLRNRRGELRCGDLGEYAVVTQCEEECQAQHDQG